MNEIKKKYVNCIPTYDGYKIQPLSVDWKRYLQPDEVELLLRAIPKYDLRVKFKVLLYTGCRYTEVERLFHNPGWYKNGKILMRSEKPESVHAYRFIQLNRQGQEAVEAFFELDKPMPSTNTWTENLRRWAKRALICDAPMDCRVTRRTWESYLAFMYPDCLPLIALSMGHNTETALRFYVSFPFDESDRQRMFQYTSGFFNPSLLGRARLDCSVKPKVFGSTPGLTYRDSGLNNPQKTFGLDNKTKDLYRNNVLGKSKDNGKTYQTKLIKFLSKRGKKTGVDSYED